MKTRRFPLLGALCALVLTVGAGLIAPSTSGAFTAEIDNTGNSARTASAFTCGDVFAEQEAASGAYFQYSLADAASSTAVVDSSTAANTGTFQGGHTTDSSTPSACPNDSSTTAATFDGSSQYVSTTNSYTAPPEVSVVVWFKTVVASGFLIGLVGAQTGSSPYYDRMITLQSSGQLQFYTYNGLNNIDVPQQVTSPAGINYADGAWHQAVATFTSTTGMRLYVDGALAASNDTYTNAEDYPGGRYWRLGYYDVGLSNNYFTGSMKYAAAYDYALTASEVHSQYTVGAPG